MVARLTPDQKAACSNHVGVINVFCFLIPQPSQSPKRIFKYMNKIGLFQLSQCLVLAENSTMSINQMLQHAQCTLYKIEKNSTGPSHDERICFRGSEYVLYEILD